MKRKGNIKVKSTISNIGQLLLLSTSFAVIALVMQSEVRAVAIYTRPALLQRHLHVIHKQSRLPPVIHSNGRSFIKVIFELT
jgi:hypothetical protein